MGRKSSLTPDQWIEVERLHVVDGKSINWLAQKYGVNESSIRRKIKPNKAELSNGHKPLRELALEKVKADSAVRDIAEQIAELPYAKQQIVSDLARKLMNISDHLSSAAEYGAMTAHRLSGIANSQVELIDDADPMKSIETLKGIAALTKTANEASDIAINLINANKKQVERMNEQPEESAAMSLSDFYGEIAPKLKSVAS